jgi:SAM-dependent methyltransferase
MLPTSFFSLSFAAKLRSSAALLLSAVVGLIRIWFRDNSLNRSRMGRIALQASLNGYRESALLYVAAKLSLIDLLAQGPRESHDLARSVGAHAVSLHRVLRGLVVMGVLSEKRDGRFAVTALGTWLLSGKQDSLRNLAILYGEGRYPVFGSLLKSVMTGEPAQPCPGASYYMFRGQHSELDNSFNTEMERHTIRATQNILAAYDFHLLRNVADLGGGHGALLAAILNSYPAHTGILFDQPHVTKGAQHSLEKAGVAERCRIIEGDFFDRIPEGADILILKNILHNWDDERSIIILRNCRKALDKGGKILLVERLMPTRARDNPDTIWLDLCVLVQTGGRERTKDEYCGLLAAAGFLFTRALPTASPLWLIEAARADDGTE